MFEVPLVETPLNITVTRFTQLGILVKSMLVPLVEATAVPLVITLLFIVLTTAPVIVGLVSVLFVSVCVAESITTLPVTAGKSCVKLLAVVGSWMVI